MLTRRLALAWLGASPALLGNGAIAQARSEVLTAVRLALRVSDQNPDYLRAKLAFDAIVNPSLDNASAISGPSTSVPLIPGGPLVTLSDGAKPDFGFVGAIMGPNNVANEGTSFSLGNYGPEVDVELFRGDIAQQGGLAASVNGAATPGQGGLTINQAGQVQSIEGGAAVLPGAGSEVSATGTLSVADGARSGSDAPLPPLTACVLGMCGTYDDRR